VEALRAVRSAVAEADFPLPLPSAAPARADAAALLGQLDDYALPRLTHLAAPLLVVVGGSTGAGKSTLVNSLVRAPVSAAGVLRPTTRAPVLVCHPADSPWFRSGRLLGTLTGTTTPDPYRLQLIAAPALSSGLAFLDAPDIDSVVDTNRALATHLFAAADLWLFVTTAARYADAVPWRLLHTARERGTVIALVLARVPPAAAVEVVTLLSEMLTEQGLASVPLFVLPESPVDRQGLLSDSAIAPLQSWFEALAGDAAARDSVIRCTLDGALAALPARLAALAAAADEQVVAAEALAEQVGLAYGVARGTVERGVRGGAHPEPAPAPAGRPAPLDEFSRAVRTSIGNWRDRMAELTGRRAGTRHRQSAAESGLVTLVRSAATDAAEQTGTAWRGHPAGRGLVDGGGGAPQRGAGGGSGAGGAPQRGAGGGSGGGGAPQRGAGGGSWPPEPSPELVRQVHRLAREAPAGDLLDRIGQLLDVEATGWLERLAGVPADGSAGQRLREAAAELERARVAARLPESPGSEPPRPAPEPEPEPESAEVSG
jgi:hypothetical protein